MNAKYWQILKQSFWAALYFTILSFVVLLVAPALITPANVAFYLYVIIILEIVTEVMSIWYQRKRGSGLLANAKYNALVAFLAATILVFGLIPMFQSSITNGTPQAIVAYGILVIPAILIVELLWWFFRMITGHGARDY